MRQQVLTSSLLIALTAQVDAQPILDDPTSCSVAGGPLLPRMRRRCARLGSLWTISLRNLIGNSHSTVNPAFSANGSPLC